MAKLDVRIDPKDKCQKTAVYDPDGKKRGNTLAFDTEEKYTEEYDLDENGKIKMLPPIKVGDRIERRMANPVRKYIDYDVVNLETGEILYKVRQ